MKWCKFKRNVQVGYVVLRGDESAAGRTHKYVQVVKVHKGTDGIVRSADNEYKLPGEDKFRIN
jgi:hypothetical protein